MVPGLKALATLPLCKKSGARPDLITGEPGIVAKGSYNMSMKYNGHKLQTRSIWKHRMHWGPLIVCFIVSGAIANPTPIIYVDGQANGSVQDGSSWCTAYRSLQEAISSVLAIEPTQFRLADGVYKPGPTASADPREATFAIPGGFSIMGGFAGCGASDADQRDPKVHQTILSGDLNGDDDPSGQECGGTNCCDSHHGQGCSNAECTSLVVAEFSLCQYDWDQRCTSLARRVCCQLLNSQNQCENSYHVITNAPLNPPSPTILNGLTIEGGFANDYPDHHLGGGLFTSLPIVIENCEFTKNYADSGGAIHTTGALTISDSVFWRNHADLGGALYTFGSSDVSISNSVFQENRVGFRSGAIENLGAKLHIEFSTFVENSAFVFAGAILGKATIKDCDFERNRCNDRGGALFLDHATVDRSRFTGNDAVWGGALATGDDVLVTNAIFTRNTADNGGAIFGYYGPLNIVNSTVVDNAARQSGGGIILGPRATFDTTNSIYWGNTDPTTDPAGAQIRPIDPSQLQVRFSCVQGWSSMGLENGVIDEDPKFMNSSAADYRLSFGSPCIDAGDSEAQSSLGKIDLASKPRLVNDPATFDRGHGQAPIIDMGAIEYQPVFLDFLPSSCPNEVSAKPRFAVPVALLSSSEFSVQQIDPTSLSLSRRDGVGLPVQPLGRRGNPAFGMRDVSGPVGDDLCACTSERDGLRDMVLHFKGDDLHDNFQLDKEDDGTVLQLILTGHLIDKTPFVAADCLTVKNDRRPPR